MMPVKADLAICVWIVQECGSHVKPLLGLVLVGLFQVFANPVTNKFMLESMYTV